MATITNTQSMERYRFSMEKPTQSMDKKLLIEQSDQGLKLLVQKYGESRLTQVEKHMIDGLPKMGLLPGEFFESCHARVVNLGSENKVYFTHPLLGGMKSSNPLMDLIESDLALSLIKQLPRQVDTLIKSIDTRDLLRQDIEAIYKSIEQSFQGSGSINVMNIMRDLNSAANLLNLARVAARGAKHKSAPLVTDMLVKYQTLVRDTVNTVNDLLSECMLSLKFHSEALEGIEDGDQEFAIESIKKCQDIARNSKEKAQKMCEKTDELCQLSAKTIVSVDEGVMEKAHQLETLEQERNTIQAQQAEYETKKDHLKLRINDVKDQEKRMFDQMDSMANKAFALGLTKALVEPVAKIGLMVANPIAGACAGSGEAVANVANHFVQKLKEKVEENDQKIDTLKKDFIKISSQIKIKEEELKKLEEGSKVFNELKNDIINLKTQENAKSEEIQNSESALNNIKKELGEQVDALRQASDKYRELALDAQNERRELQSQEIDILGTMSANIERLKHMDTHQDTLVFAKSCLDNAYIALSRVKTTFDSLEIFWENEKRAFNHIIEGFQVDFKRNEKRYVNQISQSARFWMSVTKMNFLARTAITEVFSKIGKIQQNVPDIETGAKMVQEMADTLQLEIAQEIKSKNH